MKPKQETNIHFSISWEEIKEKLNSFFEGGATGKQNYTKGNGKDPSTVGKGREGKEMEKTKNMMEQNIQRVQDARLEERKENMHVKTKIENERATKLPKKRETFSHNIRNRGSNP